METNLTYLEQSVSRMNELIGQTDDAMVRTHALLNALRGRRGDAGLTCDTDGEEGWPWRP